MGGNPNSSDSGEVDRMTERYWAARERYEIPAAWGAQS